MLVDDYVVNINSDSTRYYFKNGLSHRECGPAITSYIDKDKYLNLGDEELYRKVFINYSTEPTYLKDDDLWEYPVSLYIPTSYYLNGCQYSKLEFEAIKLKLELTKELFNNSSENKKTKV